MYGYKYFLYYFIAIAILPYILSINPEKQTRTNACLKLLNNKLSSDATLNDYMQTTLKGNEQMLSKLLTLTILSCYNGVSFYDAEEILKSNKVDPNSDENKNLLKLEKFLEYIKDGNQEMLSYELTMLSDATSDLQNGEITLQPKKENFERQRDERMDYISSPENKFDFNIFGIKLSELSVKTKNLIGLSLLCIVLIFIVYGLYYLNSFRAKDEELKKKKKEKREKKKN